MWRNAIIHEATKAIQPGGICNHNQPNAQPALEITANPISNNIQRAHIRSIERMVHILNHKLVACKSIHTD